MDCHEAGQAVGEYLWQLAEVVAREQARAAGQARIEGEGAGGEEDLGQFSKALRQVAAVLFAELVADQRVAEHRQGPHRAAPLAHEHCIIVGHAGPRPPDLRRPAGVIDHAQGQVGG